MGSSESNAKTELNKALFWYFKYLDTEDYFTKNKGSILSQQ